MGLFNVFVAYKFIKLLVQPFEKTDAYKLGLIDKKGLALKKKVDFTDQDKKAYSAIHELVWNIKRLLNKVPGIKSRLGSFAIALWLLKQKMSSEYQKESIDQIERDIVDYIEENYEKDIDNMIVESILLEDIPTKTPCLYQITDDSYCEMFEEVDLDDLFYCEGDISVGDVMGIVIHEMTHLSSGNKYPVVISSMKPYTLTEEVTNATPIQA